MKWLKKSLLALAAFVCMVTISLFGWSIIQGSFDDVARLHQSADSGGVTQYVRWGVLGTIIIFWSDIIDFFGKKKLNEQQVELAKAMHGRIAIAIIAYEILVVQSAFKLLT